MKRLLPLVGGVLGLYLPAWSVAVCAEQPAPSAYPAATDPFEAVQKAVRAEREAKARAPGGATTGREMYETDSFLENIRESLSRGADQQALNALSQLESMATTPELRRACKAMVEKIHKDRAARDEAFAVELDVAIKRAGEAILKAAEPKDLDPLIEGFNRLQEARASQYSDGRDNRLMQKIQGSIQFLSRWQEYLLALKKGDEQAQAQALRNLTENGYNNTQLVPRSEILARVPNVNRNGGDGSGRAGRSSVDTNNAVAEILSHAHSLDDIQPLLDKLLELWTKTTGNQNYSPDNNSDLGAAISNLQSLQKAQSELRAGLTTTINLAALRAENSARPAIDIRLAGLRAELLKMALPRLLGAPDTKPLADEGAAAFLRRLIDAAKARGDWASVARGLEISHTFTSNQTAYAQANVQENEAFKLFFSGLNMEAAGQFQQAAIAFLNALKTGVQDLPTVVIGEHLAAIQKAHPKEYEDATAYTLNPPSRRYPEDSYVPPTRRSADGRSRPEASGPAEITVPAATPPAAPVSPTPTPAPKASP